MALISLVISFLISISLIILSEKFNIYDLPNERKLHNNPTSKLGGIAILISYYVCISRYSEINNQLLLSNIILVILIIADEALDLNRYFRLVIQIIATLPIVLSLDLSIYKTIITIFSIILVCGFINLFNFFDGLNLLLSSQFILILTYYMMTQGILKLQNFNDDMLILIGSSFGFAILNSFGLIFMGDIGSCFMGLFSALLFLSSIVTIDFNNWIILIAPLMPIMTDTILTILIRLTNGEKFFSTPHKQHAYQLLKLLGLKDIEVSIIYIIKFIIYTLPIYYSYRLGYNFSFYIIAIIIIMDIFLITAIRKKAFKNHLI